MLRRIFCLGTVLFFRFGDWAGRLFGQEPDRGNFNVPLPTLGGKQFWGDELFFYDWRIQRRAHTDHCRLLDKNNIRVAWGTFAECQAALARIKRARNLPPMKGRAVIGLHGLGRTRAAMEGLCDYLRDKGGYLVFNVEYPSTQVDIAEHAKALASIVNHLDGVEEINFVGHSMGNIIVRYYLGDLGRLNILALPLDEAEVIRRAKRHFRRFVMLGPPNQGSQLAATFADNVLFKEIMGDAGQQLGRDWPELERHLATPDFEFGIIAGGKQNAKGYNPILKGDNDGVISIDTAKLAGAHDFAVLPSLHSFLMDNPTAREYTLRFLQRGCFVADDQRQPIATGSSSEKR